MTDGTPTRTALDHLPGWVPNAAQVYLAHTEAGMPIRAIARVSG